MRTCLAILLRLTLLLTLVVDGTLASTHAHDMGALSPTAAAFSEGMAMPCHDSADGTLSRTAQEDVAKHAGRHACCDSACACDFVLSASSAAVAWIAVGIPPASVLPIFSIGELLSPHSPRLLRPPIA